MKPQRTINDYKEEKTAKEKHVPATVAVTKLIYYNLKVCMTLRFAAAHILRAAEFMSRWNAYFTACFLGELVAWKIFPHPF